MTVKHATLTAAPDDAGSDISANAWNASHTVDNGSFVAAKVSFTATDKLLGRSTAGAGNGEEIALTSAGRALIDDADAAAQRTTLGIAGAITGTKLDDLTAPDDNTDLNATTGHHGLMPKGTGSTSTFYRSDMTQASPLPAASGSRVYNSGAVSIGASAETVITFDTERSDTNAFHSTSSNTGRFTIGTGMAGRYSIAGMVEWAASALGTLRRLSIRLNGTTYIAKTEITSIINAALPQNIATIYDLADADYVELVAFQDTVGSVNVNAAGNYSPEFALALLR